MKLALPTMGRLPTVSRDGVLRLLLLMVVWGLAAFTWGSMQAWLEQNAVRATYTEITRYSAHFATWLHEIMTPVNKVATDARLIAALSVPTTGDSRPVLRLLNTYAYLYQNNDVYLVDLRRNQITNAVGASPLRPEVVSRLEELKGPQRLMIAAGERSGLLFTTQRVDAPLPELFYVLIPISTHRANATRPELESPSPHNSFGMLAAHTAGWAWWPHNSARLIPAPDWQAKKLPGMIPQRMHVETGETRILTTIEGGEGIWFGEAKTKLLQGLTWAPLLGIILAAVAATLILFWRQLGTFSHTVHNLAQPVLGHFSVVGGIIVRGLAHVGDHLSAALAGVDETPLVDAPAALDAEAFASTETRRGLAGSASKRAKQLPRAPMAQLLEEVTQASETITDNQLRQQLENDMKGMIRKCIREGRIALLYQPIFAVRDNAPVMHEVYARLITPEGEVLAPGQFLPLTNKFGLTATLDAGVFKKVLHTHFAAGMEPPSKLALNVSGTTLDGISYLNDLLGQGHYILHQIVFEVRSQEIVRDPRALRLLHDLQRQGGELSVDYFGGGSAMLEASKAMGFDYVKLDATYFASETLPNGKNTKEELARLVNYANSIGLPVVMEKIETAEMEALARSFGVAYLQGYGLAKPGTNLVIKPLEKAPSLPPAANVTASAKADAPEANKQG